MVKTKTRLAVIKEPSIARGEAAVDLLVAAHLARKREKALRHQIADALVDSWLREAELRRELRELLDDPTLQTAAQRRFAEFSARVAAGGQ